MAINQMNTYHQPSSQLYYFCSLCVRVDMHIHRCIYVFSLLVLFQHISSLKSGVSTAGRSTPPYSSIRPPRSCFFLRGISYAGARALSWGGFQPCLVGHATRWLLLDLYLWGILYAGAWLVPRGGITTALPCWPRRPLVNMPTWHPTTPLRTLGR